MGSCVSWQRCEIALVFFRSRIGIISGISSAPFVALLCHKKAALVTCKTVKQKSYIQIECSFSVAERKGFEPLRALWALHDFQSCALDQLSHLSIYSAVSPHLTTCYIIASTSGIVKQYFEKNQFFSKIVFHFDNFCAILLKYKRDGPLAQLVEQSTLNRWV